mmetsp:Transcript_110298/g.356004  ORF Transcript_110298/g.356004 Transcript_110298/m.356004 type:complete len:94 (+) Transcript_110298:153-434(+)
MRSGMLEHLAAFCGCSEQRSKAGDLAAFCGCSEQRSKEEEAFRSPRAGRSSRSGATGCLTPCSSCRAAEAGGSHRARPSVGGRLPRTPQGSVK